MILTKEHITERHARLLTNNRPHACSCVVSLSVRISGALLETQCIKIDQCDLHDPHDYLNTIEAAWKERDDAIKEGLQLTIENSNLAQQNTELLEDVAALRLECDALKADIAERKRQITEAWESMP